MSSNDVRKRNLASYWCTTATRSRRRGCPMRWPKCCADAAATSPRPGSSSRIRTMRRTSEGFPFRHAVFGILPLLWPQLRRKTGQIRIPDEAKAGDYDLVCFGSPTWFFTTAMPLRSYLKSDEARTVLAGKPFAAYVVCRRYWSINLKEVRKRGAAQGASMSTGSVSRTRAARFGRCWRCSATSARARCASAPSGVKIPPTNLKQDFGDQAEAIR